MSVLKEHSAPGQALGYYFQLERALAWIATAPQGSYIGIETEDDVVVKLLSGETIYEQDKSSTTNYPFNPSRKDLWKTLLIWLNAATNEEIDVNNAYFYLVTNKDAKDTVAEKIGIAKTQEEIGKVIELLKEKARTISGEAKILADQVLSFPNDILSKIIERITYKAGKETMTISFRKILAGNLQLDMEAVEQNESIINELTGWLFQQVVNSWRNNLAALISRDDFHREKINILTSIRQKIVNEIMIELGEIPEEEERSQWENKYVKQLKLIGCTTEDIYKAIHDYLNAVIKRTDLAKKGYLTLSQLDDLDKNLEQHWENVFRSRKLSHKNLDAKDIGQIIYFDTIDYDTSCGEYKLRNHFLIRGSYHTLADQLKLGWHPEYRLELRPIKELSMPKLKKKYNA
ncbi:MAG: ABC-three component system protein [Ginsengibacter sp.]